VDEKVPRGNDILPRDFLVLSLEFRRDPVCGFSDDLDMVENPDLEKI